ncbi:MAG: response regulator [Desulfitobacterium sp.]
MINVVLVDDHRLVREGIRDIISRAEDIEVIGEACDGQEGVEKALDLRPDLVLMDIQMPVCNGITAVTLIKESFPESVVAMLTVVDTDASLFEALKSGADGYLLKNMSSAEFIEAIRALMRGELMVSPSLASKILRGFVNKARGKTAVIKSPLHSLSKREQEVLELISKGLTYNQVAQKLYIAENTVKNHVHNAVRKLHVQNRIQAIDVFREAQKGNYD